jgi:hypothetical protein
MAVGEALDLGNDEATRIMDGHGDGLGLQRQSLALHGDIALRVGGGAANEADMDREGLVKQILLAVDLHQAHQIDAAGEGPVVELAATQAGIDEGAQADPRQGPRLASGDIAKEVADDPLGQSSRPRCDRRGPVAAAWEPDPNGHRPPAAPGPHGPSG